MKRFAINFPLTEGESPSRSDWAFRAIWLEFRQRLGSQSTFTAQSVRIFSRTPDDLRFPFKYLFYTQCIRNQHSQFFLLQVKGMGVPFRMQKST